MTYDGDWLGGMPPIECLPEDLELASRRGVEVVVDLRSIRRRLEHGLEGPVVDAGMEYVSIELQRLDVGDDTGRDDLEVISDEAVDQVRSVLRAPGRRRVLLVDDDGTYSSMIYAIHLAADENVSEAMALRAARATGISVENEEFVKRQVRRLSSGQS